ncbi:MAG: restriction endonuclease [Fimbriimonadales bacterium]
MSEANWREMKYYVPLLAALKRLGGSGRTAEVVEAVIQDMGIPEEELAKTHKRSGDRIVRNDIQWARNALREAGFIDGTERGVWRLTQKTYERDWDEAAINPIVVAAVRQAWERQRAQRAASADEVSEALPENAEGDSPESLLEVMRALPPAGFERLCQRVLREAGFSKVEVTGRSGDGGIDGHGVLEINMLVNERVIFQCKRYAAGQSVGPGEIRNFRGSMTGRTSKGILLTTGRFTREAESEANRDGAPPIELLDGEKLVELMEQLGLGVKPRTVYDVDSDFFAAYR